MIELKTSRGFKVQVPESRNEDPSPHFDLADSAGIRAYYNENGYVVVSGLFSPEVCDKMRRLWESEVKPSRAFIYRQATARAEKHVYNDKHWVMNPILNLQSVDPVRYQGFRQFATDSILTAKPLADGFRALFAGESPKVVQSMYFEGNSATWEHQDSYYLDSEQIGSMAAAWIALEDITASAGRFFVCPRSHKIDLGKQELTNNIADNHEAYISAVCEKMRELSLEIRAPALKKGDVLFWNAWTIHGSLDSHDPDHSRSSITCHAIPESHRFLQLQTRILSPEEESVNGIALHRPKDLASMKNRAIFALETNFPKVFYKAKKIAIKAMLRLR